MKFRKSTSIPLSLLAVAAAFAPALTWAAPIKDVPAKHWAAPAVKNVTREKVMDAPGGRFDGNRPVTRYELAVTLDRMIRYIEDSHKPVKPTPASQAVTLPKHASATVRAALEHLASNRFIEPDSILLKGVGSEPVTAFQLSDILSKITLRLMDRSLPPGPGLQHA
ncbi:MAG: S-layer homology domain-containing protein [Capsulimonadaceae bacterium]